MRSSGSAFHAFRIFRGRPRKTGQERQPKPSLYGFFGSILNTSFYPSRAALRVHSLSQAFLMPSITALLHTENDGLRLGRALETLYPCDEIIVIDHGSRDGTVQVARDYGARVLSATPEASVLHYLRSVGPGWILSLDARESLSESLAASLYEWKSLHRTSPAASAFAVFLREETAEGWIESPLPQTRLVPATWTHWNGNLPSHDADALALEGELLRFVFP
jgi:cellulose synthase/poly-beta-1,6-N-acetylglucosamine synthase-like glycosyltransferase